MLSIILLPTGASISTQQPLTSVNLRVISNAECRSTYGNVIQDHHLCTSGAGGVGICAGDTGGPLVIPGSWRDTLVSIYFTYFRGGPRFIFKNPFYAHP